MNTWNKAWITINSSWLIKEDRRIVNLISPESTSLNLSTHPDILLGLDSEIDLDSDIFYSPNLTQTSAQINGDSIHKNQQKQKINEFDHDQYGQIDVEYKIGYDG